MGGVDLRDPHVGADDRVDRYAQTGERRSAVYASLSGIVSVMT